MSVANLADVVGSSDPKSSFLPTVVWGLDQGRGRGASLEVDAGGGGGSIGK